MNHNDGPKTENLFKLFDIGTECQYIYVYYSFRYIWIFKNVQGIFCHAIGWDYF